jgi:HSP20 family protein
MRVAASISLLSPPPADGSEENRMLNIVRYQPWSLMNRWHRELDQALSQSTAGAEPVRADGAAWVPSVDVYEEAGRYVVRADIPGVAAKDIDVTAEAGILTIRGDRKASEPVERAAFESIERVSGTFMRRFTLPEPAQEAGITANYANGVLEVVIPKAPRVEAKRISVTVN